MLVAQLSAINRHMRSVGGVSRMTKLQFWCNSNVSQKISTNITLSISMVYNSLSSFEHRFAIFNEGRPIWSSNCLGHIAQGPLNTLLYLGLPLALLSVFSFHFSIGGNFHLTNLGIEGWGFPEGLKAWEISLVNEIILLTIFQIAEENSTPHLISS